MHVLVIGGNGFIGSHLVDALLASGHKVRVFDRVMEKYRTPLNDVEYYLGNVGETAVLSEALEGIDVVYHLVSTTVPATSNRDPVADIESNLINTVKLLQLMQQQGIKRIIFLSSGGTVYGIPTTPVVSEDHALRPICSYGIVKVAIENYLHMFHQLYGIDYLCLRVSNPYGPRQGHLGVQGVIGTFLGKIKEGSEIQIWGDGSIIRDYIYVTDLTSLCAKAANFSKSGTFNVGSGVGTSLLDVVQVLSELNQAAITPQYLPQRSYDVPKIVLNIERAKDAFGWSPSVNLSQGMGMTWRWLQSV
ncbi:MAG: NAD-dependent epimerase [Gallionellales bacterium RIFCSPLOWO2_02_FULL_57_47]|nr:MAG: NAD-dependent epimerase [Gallionellales bacterium RIFCSPLOWO2_02_FULL_57_47]